MYLIKSYSKLNIHLGVLGKFNNNYHRIESLVLFSELHDRIFIKQNKLKEHLISFYGKFSRDVKKKNTVNSLMKILDKVKLLRGKKYTIKVEKNIPSKSGMGGGSMNAANILNYFIKKRIIKISKKGINKICISIGSDVLLGLSRSITHLKQNNQIKKYKKKVKLYLIIVKPDFGCDTKKIYNKVISYSKKKLYRQDIKNLEKYPNMYNDLEKVAFKIYPKLRKLKKDLLEIDNIYFARMTGSGSSIIGYFLNKKDALNGTKLLKKKYKNYWCISSKTI